ncbi:copper resistance protein CopC [Pseudonocardia sp. CA-107938]|uniref:copper resistance CopC family protein n=1 Tax=Pseudonocardia sp. CA-107938 TaxID=3240021 RepID=UPI003D8A26DC
MKRRSVTVGRWPLVRRFLGLLVLVAACWGALFVALPAPAGDPVLLSTSPADGAFVTSPDELRLTFDRPVPAGLATVRMNNPPGDQVVAVRPVNPPGEPATITVPMPKTRYGGTYSVAWSVPNSRLELISGTSSFSVSAPTKLHPAVVGIERDPVVVAIYAVAVHGATAALLLGIGLVFVLVVAWPAAGRQAVVRRLITSVWWTLLISTLLTIAGFGAYAARASLREAFDPALVAGTLGSETGAALLLRLLVLVPVTVALVLLLAGRPPETGIERWSSALAVLGCAAPLAATWSFAEPHDPHGPGLPAIAAETGLLLAIAIAVGGPVLLWILQRGPGDSALRTVLPRLARVMWACGALVAVVALITVGGWELAALLALATLVVATGIAAHLWVRRRAETRGKDLPGRQRLRRVAVVAASAAAVLMVATSAIDPSESVLGLWSTGGAHPGSPPAER